ncbi:MAG: TetR/AcrR family transcriptional regulator [Marinobacterium sp.]|nr:TetR/AcrR family transcriptional regulator [Marinobacterium sp.]
MNRGRRTEHSRDKILQIGAELFTRNGYHATGVKEILTTCKVPKGSFYNFFESKEHFAVEILEHYRTIEFERWHTLAAQLQGNHFERMYQIIEKEIERFGNEQYACGCLLANLSGEVSQCSPLFSATIARSIRMVHDAITDDVLQCQQEGSLRRDLPADIVADVLLNHWQGALLRCKVENSTLPLQNHLTLLNSFKPSTEDIQ